MCVKKGCGLNSFFLILILLVGISANVFAGGGSGGSTPSNPCSSNDQTGISSGVYQVAIDGTVRYTSGTCVSPGTCTGSENVVFSATGASLTVTSPDLRRGTTIYNAICSADEGLVTFRGGFTGRYGAGSDCPTTASTTQYSAYSSPLYTISWNTNQQDCECRFGANHWDAPGEVGSGSCCGYDAGENYRSRICYDSVCTTDATDLACCNEDDCVYANTCYDPVPSGTDHNTWDFAVYDNPAGTPGDNIRVICSAFSTGSAQWGNADHSQGWCIAASGEWNIGGDADIESGFLSTSGTGANYCGSDRVTTPSQDCCCGDDTDEFIIHEILDSNIAFSYSESSCCDTSTDCVDENGLCVPLNSKAVFTSTDDQSAYCDSSNTWQDCDSNAGLHCEDYCGFTMADAGEITTGEYSLVGQTACCGDDANEYVRYCEESAVSPVFGADCPATPPMICCDSPTDCVDDSGICYDSGTIHEEFGYGTCDDGVWAYGTLFSASCGDSMLEAPDEACEFDIMTNPIFADPNLQTCVDYGYASGTLDCYPPSHPNECDVDLSGCVANCNNDGVLDLGESCDYLASTGVVFGSFPDDSCLNMDGYTGGLLTCNNCEIDTSACYRCGDGICQDSDHYADGFENEVTCSADCDGSESCGDNNCAFDEDITGDNFCWQDCCPAGYVCGDGICTSNCENEETCAADCMVDKCGNTAIDAGEECDTNNLNGLSCSDFGSFIGGSLSCDGNCYYDFNDCNTCGNSNIEPGEECDFVGTQSCVSLGLGYVAGTYNCDVDCKKDTSGCTPSDLILDPGEECDFSGSRDCTTLNLGYVGGSFSCDVISKELDLSGCIGLTAGYECDFVGNRDCTTLDSIGFVGGSFTCDSSHLLDLSDCVAILTGCGDSVIAFGEECDLGNLNGQSCESLGLGFTGGNLACNNPYSANPCRFDTSQCEISVCGNGRVESGETCDSGVNGLTCSDIGNYLPDEGTLECYPSGHANECTFNTEGTDPCVAFQPVAICGDGGISGHEECDGTDLNEKKCDDFSGFNGGDLLCYPSGHADECKFDTSSCTTALAYCGDGIIDSGEICDSANLAGFSCSDFDSFSSGNLYCKSDCSGFDTTYCSGGNPCGNDAIDPGESCDTNNLNGFDCTDLGFTGGSLSCYDYNSVDACQLDTSLCTGGSAGGCGNNNINTGEACDNSNLNGQSCGTLGFVSGAGLSCDSSCNFDTSSCTPIVSSETCGDGVLDSGESCDGGFAPFSCLSFGFTGGSLSCGSDCRLDTSLCTGGNGAGICGDDLINIDETCDGTEVNDLTCLDFSGFNSGSLSCDALCQLDTSSCGFDARGFCGDGVCSYVESSSLCPTDCNPMNLGSCGDGICSYEEYRNNPLCDLDCGHISGSCGDGTCSVHENYQTCAPDCNAPICGNGVCEIDEFLGLAPCALDHCPPDDATPGDDGVGFMIDSGDITGHVWCGDSSNEYYWRCRDYEGNPTAHCGVNADSCCDSFAESVDSNGDCRASGQCYSTFSYSYATNGHWADPDLLPSYCSHFSCRRPDNKGVPVDDGLPHWLVSSDDDNGAESCCGDDPNENYILSRGEDNTADYSCCSSATDCAIDGRCYSRGQVGVQSDLRDNLICAADGKFDKALDINDPIISTDQYVVPQLSFNQKYMACNVPWNLDLDTDNDQAWIPKDECLGTLSGRVVDKYGEQVADANVRIYHYDDSGVFVDETTTNATGYYEFTDIMASYYDVEIHGQDSGGSYSYELLELVRVDYATNTLATDVVFMGGSTCMPNCVDVKDGVCSAECEGLNECEFQAFPGFTKAETIAACDTYASGSPRMLPDGTEIICCSSEYDTIQSGELTYRYSLTDIAPNIQYDGENLIDYVRIVQINTRPGKAHIVVFN